MFLIYTDQALNNRTGKIMDISASEGIFISNGELYTQQYERNANL